MKRVALILVFVLAALALAVDSSASGDGYKVRAIFDNAAFLVSGEEVKVAGASVGIVDSVDLTDDLKAAVTLKVNDDRFTPFHADAHCTIRTEGLLAVKFVDCDPGTSAAPELSTISDGPGSGDQLLTVEHTTTPVDLDLVLDTYREPAGKQLALLISELGAGVAGQGENLNEAIHRANPALRETDQVVKILASQNQQLAQFASDSDQVVSAFASRQRELAGFVHGAAGTMQATAARSDEIAQSIDRLPAFFRELQPAFRDLTHLTNRATPVLAQLGESGRDLGSAMADVQPFARNGVPALRSAGAFADATAPEFQRISPLLTQVNAVGTPLEPISKNLKKATVSLKKSKARQRLLKLFYYGAGAVNGFDANGHYARVEVLSSACSEYTPKGYFGCDSQWGPQADATKPVASAASNKTFKAGISGLAGGVPTTDPAGAGALLDFLLGSQP